MPLAALQIAKRPGSGCDWLGRRRRDSRLASKRIRALRLSPVCGAWAAVPRPHSGPWSVGEMAVQGETPSPPTRPARPIHFGRLARVTWPAAKCQMKESCRSMSQREQRAGNRLVRRPAMTTRRPGSSLSGSSVSLAVADNPSYAYAASYHSGRVPDYYILLQDSVT
jgi:hypothetical protein